ncbi:copper resistance system multicopper oxidase [Dokdonella sp.]|uniref:copper resistance system multicopper oxidase n=1 Tax=Dokdonella sp. TaxID=2291710 RepID=UPI0035298FBF
MAFRSSSSNTALPPTESRRRFLQGLAAGGAIAGLGLGNGFAWALDSHRDAQSLSGTRFDLGIGESPVNFTGAVRTATTVNGSVPAPLLRWREGDTVTLRVTNRLNVDSSIHWHGILLPSGMDGVPGFSFDGIAPGETFEYRFELKQSGTYWYHSHSRFQEQTGLYGPIVITPRDGERHPTERDYVVMLSDWSDEDPEVLFANLKKMSDYYNFNEPTAVEFAQDALKMGFRNALAKRKMWNEMRMSPADLGDVTAHTYTYLINGKTSGNNWTGLFERGERVRLRFINGSAMSIFDVRIPGLKMTVVAADGQDVEPVSVDEFRIAVAETYDVIVEPADDRAYTLFAQTIDRTGFVRGTLAPRAGMSADVPAIDPPQWLTMRDMMGAMAMGAGMEHGPGDMAGMGHGSGSEGMAGMVMANHARTEYGPGVDMRVDMPRSNLDDPGIGLRNNGRDVLTYADLHTIGGQIDPRKPGREIELHMTGNMERYMWSFDGQKFNDAKPVHFRYGERLRVVLVNDTMMPHPIHLHGLWSDLENPQGEFQVRKHTIMVQPAQRVSYRVSADALGRWAYHCHLLYHMEAGMFREVVVS